MSNPVRVSGRPTTYNEELAELICERIAITPEGLAKICEMYDDMPTPDTIRKWCLKYYDTFGRMYKTAKRVQAELLAETLDDLAKDVLYYTDKDGNLRIDPGSVQAARLRVDTRKWIASKLASHLYGDVIVVADQEEQHKRMQAEIKLVRERLDAQHKRDY